MICPKCKAEYREGFDVCSDCGVPLVTELPIEDAVMGREFNCAELNLLKYLKSYRYMAICMMIVLTAGILLAIYFLLFLEMSYEVRHLNLIYLNGMVTMLALSFYLYVSIRTIEKLQAGGKFGKIYQERWKEK